MLAMARLVGGSGDKGGAAAFGGSIGVVKHAYDKAMSEKGQPSADIVAITEMSVRFLHALMRTYKDAPEAPDLRDLLETLHHAYPHSTLGKKKRVTSSRRDLSAVGNEDDKINPPNTPPKPPVSENGECPFGESGKFRVDENGNQHRLAD